MGRTSWIAAVLGTLAGCTCGGGTGAGGGTQLAGIVEIAAGGYHTCARNEAGEVLCWGTNAHGQLGTGSTADVVERPTVLGTLTAVKQLALGREHSCALLETATFSCWGDNRGGQLGDGTTTEHREPRHVEGLRRVEEVSAAGMRSCVRTQEHTVWCVGIVDVGGREPAREPMQVPGLNDVEELDVAHDHACVRHGGGTVSCWGQNPRGELGDGTTTDRASPTAVPGLTGVAEVAVAERRTCVRMADGTVRCWGYGNGGGLGTGSTADANPTPAPVAELTGVVQISLGESHDCARKDDGTVWCWGDRYHGQVGDGRRGIAADRVVRRPVQVTGITDAAQIAAGDRHTCARLAGGTVRCWGYNVGGALGDATRQERWAPVDVLAP